MHCEECGLLLDGVEDKQILRTSKYSKEMLYCPKHANEVLG